MGSMNQNLWEPLSRLYYTPQFEVTWNKTISTVSHSIAHIAYKPQEQPKNIMGSLISSFFFLRTLLWHHKFGIEPRVSFCVLRLSCVFSCSSPVYICLLTYKIKWCASILWRGRKKTNNRAVVLSLQRPLLLTLEHYIKSAAPLTLSGLFNTAAGNHNHVRFSDATHWLFSALQTMQYPSSPGSATLVTQHFLTCCLCWMH